MRGLYLPIFGFILLALASTAGAQQASMDEANASMPSSVRIEGLLPVYQDVNRCSAAALTIQLSYFIGERPYDAVIRGLNPNTEDVSVRLDEMVRYAEETYGLKGVIRYGGTLDMLKSLLAAGFPVLVENVYYDGAGGFDDWLSHNRIVMGYDDALQEIYTFDPLLGNGPDNTGRPIPYTDVDERWRPFNRDLLVLYRPEEEQALRAALGAHWDTVYNLNWALSLSEQELAGDNPDSFSLFNKGETLTLLGRYEEAAEAFDQARAIGLPWRVYWYMFGIFEAYLAVGRYDDVIALARSVIAGTPGVEEVYYYAARAFEATNDLLRAQANYEVAVMRNQYYTEARDALARLRGTPSPQAASTPAGS
jgi:tetratricopeptide (TPR) repeat protein